MYPNKTRLGKPHVLAMLFLLALFLLQPPWWPTRAAQAEDGQPPAITDNMQCGNCGMYPAKFPQWQCQIVMADGTAVAFDGMKCLCKYRFKLLSDDAKQAGGIKTIWVKDYASGQWLHAEDATLVGGSAIMGPMGKELIPFAKPDEAAAFQAKNGGSSMAFTAITPDTLAALMGGMNGHHMMGK